MTIQQAEPKVTQKKSRNVLLDYGLTNKEADVYIFLAKNMILTAGEIAKHTKISRSVVYRILDNLQAKGFVEPTLESPTRFMALPFDKALDLIINTKKQEALKVEREKQDLLEDWKTISKKKSTSEPEKFVIIEGAKKINLKMFQMLRETKKQFMGILTIPCLARAEQFGVFDAAHNNPLKNRIKFQLVTEVNGENLEAVKLLKPKLNSELDVKTRNPRTEITHLPRMVTKDKEEVLFFIRPEDKTLKRKQGDVCVYTNCTSLVETFSGIFQNFWSTSIKIDEKIRELENDKLPETHHYLENHKIEEKIDSEEDVFPKTVDEEKKLQFASVSDTHLLKEEERDFLDVASVIGEHFSPEIIEKVTGSNRLKVIKALINIETEHHLIQADGEEYQFHDSKIRETLYTSLKPKLRRAYHSLIAKYLEETYKDQLDNFASKLGYHYFESKNPTKAIPYLLKAGEKSRRQFEFSEALENYSRILQMIGNNKIWRKEKLIAIENFADLCASIGDHERANDCYSKGIEIAENVTTSERMRRKIRRKRVIVKNGEKVPYFIYGEGEPTILLIWYSTHFMPQIQYFSQKQKVAIMDLRELYDVENLPTEYTVNLFTENLGAIIEDLQDSKIHLVGIGFGGTLAIKYVAENPKKIAKLALLATPPKPLIFVSPEKKKSFEEFWAQALQSPSWGLKKFNEKILGAVYPQWPGIESRLGIKTPRNCPPEIVLIGWKLLIEADIQPYLEKIQIPTLILHGEKDIMPLKSVKYMKKRIPNSQLYIFKDADVVSLTKPKEFNRVLEQFLNTGQILRT